MNNLADRLQAWGCDVNWALTQAGDVSRYRATLDAFVRNICMDDASVTQQRAAELGLHPLWQEAYLLTQARRQGEPAAIRAAEAELRRQVSRLQEILRRY